MLDCKSDRFLPGSQVAGSRRLCIQLRAAQSFLHSFANIGRARWGAELAARAAGAGLVHNMVAQLTKMIASPQNIWFVDHEMGCMVDFYKDTREPKD